jgi:transcription elongation GreA/GreB family factor
MSPKDAVVDIGRARFEGSPVDPSHAAGLGSTVEVEDLATGAELAYRLVEVHDAVPNRTAPCRSHLPSARRFARIVSARW